MKNFITICVIILLGGTLTFGANNDTLNLSGDVTLANNVDFTAASTATALPIAVDASQLTHVVANLALDSNSYTGVNLDCFSVVLVSRVPFTLFFLGGEFITNYFIKLPSLF